MNKTMRTMIAAGLSALALGGVVAGQGIASGNDRAERAAQGDAKRAARALERRDGPVAIRFAEEAVAQSPRSAAYRMLLGQAYLQGGRFASAATAFGDVLSLDGGNAKAALNLALAQIATGDWNAARATLDNHAERIPAADRGLALALAGDPAGAVGVLMEAARAPGASAKVRQNLALALALSGQWQAARAAASADMSPADVDARLEQWAAFAQPNSASDQVASLIGVRPAADPGQPVALALSGPVPVLIAPAAPRLAAVAPAPIVPAPAPAVVAPAAAPPMMAAVVFGPRREVVQPIPVPLLRPDANPARMALVGARITPGVQPLRVLRTASAPLAGAEGPIRRLDQQPAVQVAAVTPPPARGNWFVQLGAYQNAAVARDAWGRFTRQHATFTGRTPNGATVRSGGASLFRLSVGGFARGDADGFCRRFRTQGGTCFVRAGAGDQSVRWGGQGMQVASR